MTSSLRFAASQLAACSLTACLWAAGPAASGQSTPETLNPTPQANPVGLAERGGRLYRPCTRVFDGRGEKVLAGQMGSAAGNAAECPAARAPARPAEAAAEVKPPEPEKQVKPRVDKPAQGVPPTPPASAITAGHTVADPSENEVDTPIAPHISAGRLSATLVTGGTAVFLLQSGLWTYLLLLGLPLWKHVDLLPIVDTAAHEADTGVGGVDAADEDTAVTDVLEPRTAPRDTARDKA